MLVKAKGYVYIFEQLTRVMTRPFTCRAIARPFARLAIARFYVYGLMRCFPYSAYVMIFHPHLRCYTCNPKKLIILVVTGVFGIFTIIFMSVVLEGYNQSEVAKLIVIGDHDNCLSDIATVSFVLCANAGDGSRDKHDVGI